ncbi:diguanylate cyclase domain-containing protein [Comamonas sp. GB3 AK4-5]|uniref:GGDEF domain-containing protein n=1 Tax=Comamonas sp. GB3 AK4-5 TaxID=3231487 RepID=UPI00351E8E76
MSKAPFPGVGSSEILLALVQPLLAVVVACLFLALARLGGRLRYFDCFGAAFVLYALGSAMQVARVPEQVVLNVLASGLAYSGAAVCFAQGLAQIAGRSVWRSTTWLMAAALLVRAWFVVVDDQVTLRLWTLQLSVTAVLALGTWQTRALWQGGKAERFFFVVLVGFTASFVPRTLLTLPEQTATLVGYDRSPYWLGVQICFYVFGLLFTLALLVLTASRLLGEAREHSLRDPLTRLHNRRGLESHLLPSGAFSLILLDIDHFKRINDRWGHRQGDKVLAELACILQQHMRPSDVVARLGGEEFALYLPGAPQPLAEQVAERLRQTIALHAFSDQMACTCSFGVAGFDTQVPFDAAYGEADQRLYQAKAQGRNCVVAG